MSMAEKRSYSRRNYEIQTGQVREVIEPKWKVRTFRIQYCRSLTDCAQQTTTVTVHVLQ